MKREGIILGIDPGTRIMGYGVIKATGSGIETLALGVIRMASIRDPYRRMSHILEKVYELLDEYKPDSMAIEAPFYSKNVQSMLKLGRAQGLPLQRHYPGTFPLVSTHPVKLKWLLPVRSCFQGTGRRYVKKDFAFYPEIRGL